MKILIAFLQQVAWACVAKLVSRPRVADWLIQRSARTPYFHLPGYMDRFWLFNAYQKADGAEVTTIGWLPSVRVHHILREDGDRHLHDHPWNARTIILRGHYVERRREYDLFGLPYYETYRREAGDTARVLFGEFHSIDEVSDGGVWTIFITYGYQDTWGFLVGDVKVPWRDYKDMFPDKPWADEREAA